MDAEPPAPRTFYIPHINHHCRSHCYHHHHISGGRADEQPLPSPTILTRTGRTEQSVYCSSLRASRNASIHHRHGVALAHHYRLTRILVAGAIDVRGGIPSTTSSGRSSRSSTRRRASHGRAFRVATCHAAPQAGFTSTMQAKLTMIVRVATDIVSCIARSSDRCILRIGDIGKKAGQQVQPPTCRLLKAGALSYHLALRDSVHRTFCRPCSSSWPHSGRQH